MAENSKRVRIADLERKETVFPYEIEKRAARLFTLNYLPSVKTGLFREGIAVIRESCDEFLLAGWRFTFGATAMEMKENLNEAIKEAEDARVRLRDMMVEFRSKTKNDLDSMGALGKQIRKEMDRIQESMNITIHLMTSAPMLEAIENAQRLAGALGNIDKLRSTRISFAIIDKPLKSVLDVETKSP